MSVSWISLALALYDIKEVKLCPYNLDFYRNENIYLETPWCLNSKPLWTLIIVQGQGTSVIQQFSLYNQSHNCVSMYSNRSPEGRMKRLESEVWRYRYTTCLWQNTL